MNKDMVLGLVRHILTFGGGLLVTKGAIDAPGLDTLVGAIVTIIGVAWSIWAKREPTP